MEAGVEGEVMGTYQKVTEIVEFEAPWGRVVGLQDVVYEGGMRLLRLRIREGRRLTDLELTPDNARQLAQAVMDWARDAGEEVAPVA